MSRDPFVHVFPGSVIGAELPAPASGWGDERALDRAAWKALAAGAPLFDPLALEVVSGCVDPTTGVLDMDPGPETTSYFLRRDGLPPAVAAEVSPAYQPSRGITVAQIDEASLLTALAELRREPCGPGLTATWFEINVDAVAARLPEVVEKGAATFRLEHDRGTAFLPIERRSDGGWVLGPSEDMQHAPLHLTLQRSFNDTVRFRLELRWSVWTEVGSAGAGIVQDYLSALAALGWRLERA
jgi:hypothetical protein